MNGVWYTKVDDFKRRVEKLRFELLEALDPDDRTPLAVRNELYISLMRLGKAQEHLDRAHALLSPDQKKPKL